MKQFHFRLRFTTPAFLGNADQDGQWRTPPIKALLRQWWRVAYAADAGPDFSLAEMRGAEGRLFGLASAGEGSSSKSLVRIRLSRWDIGRMSSWAGQDADRVMHPDVGARVGAHLYLGFGPLTLPRGQRETTLKARAAIQAGEESRLSLAFPQDVEGPRLHRALWMAHHYGTVGGRSRNGWGSLSLHPADDGSTAFDGDLNESLTRTWQDALSRDWPHAIGRDADGPLIWQTAALPDWKAVMLRLAEVKIGLRRQFVFPDERTPHPQPLSRHWLAYPITHHETSAWPRNARLPNSMRFKVRAERDGKLRGVIFHVPCLPPQKIFSPDRRVVESVWQQVHDFLNRPEQGLQRIAA